MKIEISVQDLGRLAELKTRCYKLANLDEEDFPSIDIWYFEEKGDELSGLMDFLDNPERYIDAFERMIREAEECQREIRAEHVDSVIKAQAEIKTP